MALAIIIFCITILCMILSILFLPKIKLGKIGIDCYWLITLLGAIVLIIATKTKMTDITSALTEDSAINPLKILTLFISMTVLSVFLDELGFFKYLANVTLKKAKSSQVKLFLYLYVTVSILTVFTSNDIIILSFTPFICYFCRNAEIDPMPYLSGEFVAANTWSMALIIGNPTNIYLANANGINFVEYLKTMIVPTLLSGVTAFIMLYILFRRKLSKDINATPCIDVGGIIKNKTLLVIGVIHLAICTVMLSISSYIGVEMWLVSLLAVVSLTVFTVIFGVIQRKLPTEYFNSLKRAPWQLIPFVLSMFAMIIVLSNKGITEDLGKFFGESWSVYVYGGTSFISSNIINNIPMSVLFCKIIETAPTIVSLKAVFGAVIGSNLGAIFTPIGALAGIMFSSILQTHGVKFKYLDFLKMGIVVTLPTLLVALSSLTLFV